MCLQYDMYMLFCYLGEILRFVHGFLQVQDLLLVHCDCVLYMLPHVFPNCRFSHVQGIEFILLFCEANLHLLCFFAFLLKLFIMRLLPLVHQLVEPFVYAL